MTEETLKLALDALEELYNTNSSWWQEVDKQTLKKIENSITALEEALAQTQEPVSSDPLPRACNLAGVDYQTFLKIKAYMPVTPPQRTEPKIGCVNHNCDKCKAQRTWVGLTADEIWDEWLEQSKPERNTHNFVVAFTRAIEAKLKQKNGYAEENT